MVDFFDKIYTRIQDRNVFFSRMKIYSFQRLMIRVLSNVLIPVFFQFRKRKHLLKQDSSSSIKYIVSLTSFPGRIGRVWIVIESILRQTHKPDKIILWLSEDQFKTFGKLPRLLLNQQKRGLEIKFVEGDLKSHKKYYYSLKEYPNDFLITVDDDIIYPTTLISQLIDLNKIYPLSICCHRAHRIKYEDNHIQISAYSLWEEIMGFSPPSFNIFFTTGGGTLFPPGSLHVEVLREDVFKQYCFYADDVWLNIMSRLCFTTIVKSEYHSSLLPVINYKNVNLYTINLILGENDKQLQVVREYYIKKLNIDTFNIKQLDNENF